MNGRIRLSLAALFVAMLLGTLTAAAQPLVWNPPCPTLRVKNVTGAAVTITLTTTPPGLIPPLTAPPFNDSPTVPVPPGTAISGVISFGGFFYPVIQPGPPSPPAPLPSNGWIPSVLVGPPPGSCVDLYLDLTNCTVYVFPGKLPCRP
jgi:hypothetical protein